VDRKRKKKLVHAASSKVKRFGEVHFRLTGNEKTHLTYPKKGLGRETEAFLCPREASLEVHKLKS